MASVGTVFYDVLPRLDGFAAKVAAEVGKAKPVKVKVEADTKSAEASAKRLTSVQAKEAQVSSARRMALIQRDAIAENKLRDRSIAATKRASAQKMALIQRDAIAENKLRDRSIAVQERNAARQVAAQAKITASQQKAAAAAAAQAKAARSQAVGSLGTGLLVGGAATIAALAGIVKVTADFDQAVSGVASTGKEARASIAQLRAEAIKYGADTSFSAKEAANAQEELIKANVSVTDTVNGGLKGALDLAAAGSLGVADAAGIMGTALSQFQLDGTQASHVADLLAAGAGKAQGEVQDFAEALKYVGPNAQAAGVGIEETVGTLAMFANQGILGSQAGTSLRSMLVSLTAPAGAGAKAMAEYGINVRDASGEFIGFEAAAAELRDQLGNLGQAERDAALARIFGKNSLTAATILYEGGADGVRQWTAAVNESGYAQDVARTKMDNLKGDVEKLGGAFQSAFIETGSASQGGARTAVQAVTGIVDAYSKLPEAGKNVAFIGAGLAAAAALGAGGVIKLIGVVNEARVALQGLNISAKTAGLAAGGIGAGVAVAAAVVGHFAIKSAEAAQRTDDLTQALLTSKGAIDSNIASTRAKSLEDSGALKAAQDLGISIEDVTQASLGNMQAQARVNAALGQYTDGMENARAVARGFASGADGVTKATAAQETAANKVRDAVHGGTRELRDAEDAYKRQNAAQLAAAGGADAVAASFRQSEIAFRNGADGIGDTGAAAQYTTEELEAMAAAARHSASEMLALSGGAIAVEAAMDDAAAAAKRNGKNLDIGTAKGRDNQTALDRLVATTEQQTEAMEAQGKSAESIAKVNERAKQSWIDNAVAMGKNRDKAKELADSLFELPDSVTSQIVVSGAKVSAREAKDLNAALKGIPKEQRARIVTIANTKGAKEARVEVAKVKSKNVITKATAKGVDKVKEIDGAIKKLRSKKVQAEAKEAGKKAVQALDAAIRQLKSRRVKAEAVTSGIAGVRALNSAMDAARSKTVYLTVKKRGGGPTVDKDGGTMGRQYLRDGGTVRGVGGPRQDNIATFDRGTGVQVAWTSVGEELVNARSSAMNRDIIKQINANPGKRFGLVGLANGGTIGKPKESASRGGYGSRPLILNIDMGDLGIRRIVTEIVEDRDEYSASVGRMH